VSALLIFAQSVYIFENLFRFSSELAIGLVSPGLPEKKMSLLIMSRLIITSVAGRPI
jgi:hypothetical protein